MEDRSNTPTIIPLVEDAAILRMFVSDALRDEGGFRVDPTTVAQFREAVGVDSGRGQLVAAMRSDPFILRSCREIAANLELSGLLAR